MTRRIIDSEHLQTLIRHGSISLEHALLMRRHPLFAGGATEFVSELTSALNAARNAPHDSCLLRDVDDHPKWPEMKREGGLLLGSDVSVPVLGLIENWGWHPVVLHQDDDVCPIRYFWEDPTDVFSPEDLRERMRGWVPMPDIPEFPQHTGIQTHAVPHEKLVQQNIASQQMLEDRLKLLETRIKLRFGNRVRLCRIHDSVVVDWVPAGNPPTPEENKDLVEILHGEVKG